jgi:hypothetical protein
MNDSLSNRKRFVDSGPAVGPVGVIETISTRLKVGPSPVLLIRINPDGFVCTEY